ncbi:uncharacterized protein LOC121825630 [Peromyscus maniculatus bairdii]|uniref:uncharacterized protein LOC121825630 n=1 Tax=Peromyscus maniculatus bairdii TaxID=230844 RepID=UPI001C2EFE66|nr:testis-specific chromodomain protein Y 2-like [Peromyscus maniculatus bairdii]
MPSRNSRKIPRLSMAKNRKSTPSVVEIAVPSRSVKKRERAADLQTKSPEKLGQAKQGHQGMLTQGVATEEPNEALLGLQEKVETGGIPLVNPQASGLVTVAMATRLAVVRGNQSLSGPVTTAMSTRLSVDGESQSSPDPTTTAMSTSLAVARKSQSSSVPVATAMSTRLSMARKSQSSPGPMTTAMATRFAVARKSQSSSGLGTTAMSTRLSMTRKGQSSPSPMATAMSTRFGVARKSQSSSVPVTTAMSTLLSMARKSQSSPGPVSAAMSMRLAVARKSHSSSGLGTTAMSTLFSVTRKGQFSPGPMSTAMAIDRRSPTTITTRLASHRKNKFPSDPVTRATATCLAFANNGPVTTAMATGLAVTKKSQLMSDLITAPTATHLVAAKNSYSLSDKEMAAIPMQLAVTSKSQSSSCPMTTDLATPLTIATTGQSPSLDTSNMKQPVTEITNKKTPVPDEMAKNKQLTSKKRPERQVRFSVRVTESAFRFRDIVVRKQDGFTHIFLSTKSSENNSLNLEVMNEVQNALNKAANDDSKLVLLSAIGSVFCFGLDFSYFIQRLTGDKKRESTRMAGSIKNFVNTFIRFKKPIIAAVNGPAIGLGASILPLCDVVWANEKAWFQTPYTTFGQSPDGCSSFTFPKIMGEASANEMLLSGRKLTAQEACKKGLVSQVFWPQTFTQEVMIRIKELASCNAVVLEETKALLRFNTKTELEQANERECTVLKNIWGSVEGVDAMLKYLQKKIEF